MDQLQPLLISLGISMAVQLFFFIFAFGFKTDKLTDFSYGLTFIIIAGYWFLSSDSPLVGSRLILTLMVVLWAIRLSTYLLIRIHKTGRDARFDDKRNDLVKFGSFWALQGFAVWSITLPVVYILANNIVPKLGIWSLLGIYIWAIGICIETVADYQLYRFRFLKKAADKKHPWIDEGLWHFSRHPNYFGEITLWWGVFVFGVTAYQGAGWLVIAGPISITVLLLFVSGIPLLEKAHNRRWGSDKNYQEYKRSTSLLVPLPKRKQRRVRQSL